MAGVSANGFEKKSLSTIRSEIEARFRTSFGLFINLLPGSVFQTIVGIFAERESDIWDLAEEIYNAHYPDTAEGNNLDNAVQFNGITRLESTKSVQPNQLFFGDIGTLIPAGTQLSVLGNPLAKFLTRANVTLVIGMSAQQTITPSTPPASGTYRLSFRGQKTTVLNWNSTSLAVQAALNDLSTIESVTVTGNLASGLTVSFVGADGLQPQPLILLTDNTVQDSSPDLVEFDVITTVAGVAQGMSDAEASETGEVDAPPGSLTNIDTPVSGLVRTVNSDPVVLGRARETDAELRLRRAGTLQVAGNATPDAIKARVRNIIGVRNALVFENKGLAMDGDGRPGKSYEVIVDGGDNQAIGDVLWNSKPAGIEMFGDITQNVLDSGGVTRQVKFSRPGLALIYFSLDLTVDPVLFPINGAALAESTIISWGNALGIGVDIVVYPQLVAQLNSIPGILDVTVRIDTSPVLTTPGSPAVDDNVVLGPDEAASFDGPRGNVNVI